jgi:hypothetical protein
MRLFYLTNLPYKDAKYIRASTASQTILYEVSARFSIGAFIRTCRDILTAKVAASPSRYQNIYLRQSMSPEFDAMKAKMMAILVRDSEGCLDEREMEALQITVRIACEFFMFLQGSNDAPELYKVDYLAGKIFAPELDEAEYMAGTIRSGMDWFFSIAQTGRILTGLDLKIGFDAKLPSTFSELKQSYESVFGQVAESPHSAHAMGLLLSLVQMMFLFMTVYFPSFLSFSSESGSA